MFLLPIIFFLVFFFSLFLGFRRPNLVTGLSGRRAPLFVRKKGRNNSKRTIRKLARIYGNREISRSHEPQIHFQTDRQTNKHFRSTHTVGRILAATVMPAIVNCLYLVSFTGHRKVQDSSSTVSWVLRDSSTWLVGYASDAQAFWYVPPKKERKKERKEKKLTVAYRLSRNVIRFEVTSLVFSFLSWVSKTQPNHWTMRMASTLVCSKKRSKKLSYSNFQMKREQEQ